MMLLTLVTMNSAILKYRSGYLEYILANSNTNYTGRVTSLNILILSSHQDSILAMMVYRISSFSIVSLQYYQQSSTYPIRRRITASNTNTTVYMMAPQQRCKETQMQG